MTPEHWTLLLKAIRQRHRDEEVGHDAIFETLEFPNIEELQPAEASDIIEGAIIYYPNDDPPFWQAVHKPTHHGDPFKAYEADDGCRYGLDGAYVRKRGKR